MAPHLSPGARACAWPRPLVEEPTRPLSCVCRTRTLCLLRLLLQIGKCGYPRPLAATNFTTSAPAKRFHDSGAATIEAEVVAVRVGVAGPKSLSCHVVDLGGFKTVAYGGELSFETVNVV
jgi:hypothetical protein